MTEVRHIYVHVPFCSGKCVYCNFYSELYAERAADNYLNALQKELATASSVHALCPETIYLGGGTPSLLPPRQLQRLLQILHQYLNLESVVEWTLEGNPGTLSPEKIALIREEGVNRVSLGAQSMDDKTLSDIGRRHTALQTGDTVKQLRSAGIENIGLDLIACLPGVDEATWHQTLTEIIEIAPPHLSVYALSVEPGSLLYSRWQRQATLLASSEAEQAALAAAETALARAGYDRYEISNYSQVGHRCLHNVAVWSGADYIGFGPSAASRIGSQRRTNDAALSKYCEAMSASGAPPGCTETLTAETDAIERFMFTFRLLEGVSAEGFARKHGPAALKLLPSWREKLTSLKTAGLVQQAEDHWALTPHGRLFADTVAEYLLP